MTGAADWSRVLVDGLAAAGVAEVVVSPGSRSTPLVAAALASPRLRVHAVIDERAAAFFALGLAKAGGRPVAVICTSGSAGAHFYPAVLEAEASCTPLVLLTADRPAEVQRCAAAQTVDQLALFGAHVRHFAPLAAPEPLAAAVRGARRSVAQAVLASLWPLPGPVHVNVPLRPPLEPRPRPEAGEAGAEEGTATAGPRVFPPATTPAAGAVEALAAACRDARRAIVVAGPGGHRDATGVRTAVASFCAATGFPLLAEATSGLRAPLPGVAQLASFELMLDHPPTRAGLRPDLVVEIGAPPVSAAYAAALEAWDWPSRWVLAPYGWNDPHSTATALILAEPAETLAAVAASLGTGRVDRAWRAWAEAADAAARAALADVVGGEALSELAVARVVWDRLAGRGTLMVGNSLPVRDLDLATGPDVAAPRVVHQRGAAGIDGLVAGACGVATAGDAPVALLLGDVSLAHDLSSLALGRDLAAPLVVVVVDNGGGRIFDLLPIARAGIEMRFWRTPPAADLAAVAAAFGVRFARATDVSGLDAALRTALGTPGLTLVAATVGGEGVAAERRALRAAAAVRLAALPPAP